MAVYWISFRIHDDAGYSDAYDLLVENLNSVLDTHGWWVETTSFIVAESELDIDELAEVVASAIRVDRDLAIIGMPNYKSGRVVGRITDQDLFKLMPFMKKA